MTKLVGQGAIEHTGPDEAFFDLLDNIRCSDCRHFEYKLCKGRGLRGMAKVVDECLMKRVKVISRTLITINGRLLEIKRGRTRKEPVSIILHGTPLG